ncbi:MAG: sodium:calcium antiporter [Nitrospirae bacterium]|nr:sodium:calcium antiporter [Nitrospirota bacterium]
MMSLILITTIVVAIGVILGGAVLFTNGVEWLGKRLGVSDGVVGSVFAGVGTALPETVIPIIAIFFGAGADRQAIGLGAILGAPFMLSTLTLPLLGAGLLLFAALGRRPWTFRLDSAAVSLDLRFFLVGYAVAIGAAFTASRAVHAAVAVGLIALYLVYLRILVAHDIEGHGEDLAPLYFLRRSTHPGYIVIALQVIAGLGVIIWGAHLFVGTIQTVATIMGLSPLLLSLLITPIATELPEKLNSLIWISQKKDVLAVGNITGAMVFQGTFPVAVGLLGTPWQLDEHGIVSACLALLAAAALYATMRWRGAWRPAYLMAGAVLYLGFGLYLVVR